jgi:DNA-binding NtrC family response regulator
MATAAHPAAHLAVQADQKRVLVASSNAAFRKQLIRTLLQNGGSAEEVASGAQALSKLESASYDVLFLDRNLPDLISEEVADLVRHRFPGVGVQFIDSSNAEAVTQASGLLGPVGVPAAVTHPPMPPAFDVAPTEPNQLPNMVGDGRAMRQVYHLARLVAQRSTTVLLTGETGTGKELVARAIHEISPRSKNPFVVVNCAAIPESLLEAELFGHMRGAFTGAVQSRVGRIHAAHGGSLFLDEIGDLPLSMQAKLLRFLQEGEVQRLGSSDIFRVDARVTCAANVDLLACVKQKLFREDLYYRIAIFPIELPPLRDRPEDLGPLAERFLSTLCGRSGLPNKRLSASATALLRQRQWLGNVRELKHAVERAFILAGNEPQLHVEHFSRTDDPIHFKEL